MTEDITKKINTLETEFYQTMKNVALEKGVFNSHHTYVIKGNKQVNDS